MEKITHARETVKDHLGGGTGSPVLKAVGEAVAALLSKKSNGGSPGKAMAPSCAAENEGFS